MMGEGGDREMKEENGRLKGKLRGREGRETGERKRA